MSNPAPLHRDDLYSLEQYDQKRAEFRKRVIAHKKNRQISLGDHARLCFEDRLTIQYQIQEMLRIEKIFDAEGIQEELDAYNPLIPDGHNLKATFMIEYDDVEERKQRLAELLGIEEAVWLQVDSCGRVYPIANEDLERSTDEKTSAVHFLRFELNPDMQEAMHSGASISIGCNHPNYCVDGISLSEGQRHALVQDLAVS